MEQALDLDWLEKKDRAKAAKAREAPTLPEALAQSSDARNFDASHGTAEQKASRSGGVR